MEQTTKVVTGKVRFSYVAVFQPKAMDEKSEPKYSVSIIIPKNDKATLERINKAIEAAKVAGKAKLADKAGKIPANIKVPLRDGDTDRPDDEAYADAFFINASSNRKPGVVDAQLNEIIAPEDFYSGCYGRASINFYAFNVSRTSRSWLKANRLLAPPLSRTLAVRTSSRTAICCSTLRLSILTRACALNQ